MAVGLLKRVNTNMYRDLLTNIRDQHGYGHDVYPKTLAAAHNMLEYYYRSRKLDVKSNLKSNKKRVGKEVKGMFNQTELVAGTNGKIYKTVQCRFCQDWGHYQSHCPKVGQQHMNMENEEEDDEDEGANNELRGASNLQIDQ